MDGTVGYISLNNINKISEYILPNILIFIGFSISLIYNNYCSKSLKKSDFFSISYFFNFEKIIQIIYLYIIFYILLAYFGVSGFYLYATPLVISTILFYNIDFEKIIFKDLIFLTFSYFLLIFFCLSQTNYFPVILLIIILYSFVLYLCGNLFFSFSILVFSTKLFFVGPSLIGDAFHSSEHFLASSQIFLGLFKVFPNIGYLEELPGYYFAKLLNLISFGYIQISIATSRTIIWVVLEPIILWYAYKRNKYLSALFILAIPIDRISLLISLVYTLIITTSFKNKNYILFIISVSFIPYIFMGLSPSYSLIPLVGLIALFPFSGLCYKRLFLILSIWIAILTFSYDLFKIYITTYLEFNRYFNIGFSTTISTLPIKDLIFWPIFTLLTSIIVTGVINIKDNLITNIIKSILIIALLFKFVSYGYGRIDPGFSRLLPLGIPLIYVANLFAKSYKTLTAITLILVLIFYSHLNFPKNINFNLNNNKYSIVDLDESNKLVVNNINNFAVGRKVINYSMEPALSNFINNSLVPPFTSPYVTLGIKPQNDVLNFIRGNKDAVIYLGHTFITFDGVDVRLRAPIIFKYLAENYTYYNQDGNIFAVANVSDAIPTSFNIFFNDLDIKKSALFYTQYEKSQFKYRDVIVDCSNSNSGRFKIWSEHNFIYGDLNCGQNLIPDVFFWGETKKVEKMQ